MVEVKDPAHGSAYSSVYVNDIGKDSFMTDRRPRFPIGSVIVREKYSGLNSSNQELLPELLVVMIKREVGFNHKGNDWEYIILDGAGAEIKAREKSGACYACHKRQKDEDFVFRTYLPKRM